MVWAIGFRADWSWLGELGVLRRRAATRSTTAARRRCPGFYFLGLPWLHTWGSGRFAAIARDAEHVAEQVVTASQRSPRGALSGHRVLCLTPMASVTMAAVAAHFGRDLERTLAKLPGIVEDARGRGIDLLVLPDATLGGYLLDLRHPVDEGDGIPHAGRDRRPRGGGDRRRSPAT